MVKPLASVTASVSGYGNSSTYFYTPIFYRSLYRPRSLLVWTEHYGRQLSSMKNMYPVFVTSNFFIGFNHLEKIWSLDLAKMDFIEGKKFQKSYPSMVPIFTNYTLNHFVFDLLKPKKNTFKLSYFLKRKFSLFLFKRQGNVFGWGANDYLGSFILERKRRRFWWVHR